jgi:hypothetical protein
MRTSVDVRADPVARVCQASSTTEPERHASLKADLLELIARFNQADDGTMVVPSEYLEGVIVKR